MESPLRYSWILPGKLAVGERPRTLAELQEMGFTAVLSLQEEHEPHPSDSPPAGLAFRRVAIRDGIVGGVPTIADLREAVDALRGFLESGARAYVHCYAGVGRSPTICMAYLAKCQGFSLGEAYRQILALHSPACPTAGQLAALAQFLLDGAKPR